MEQRQIEAYHGTRQPSGSVIQQLEARYPHPMPTSVSAQYSAPGETCRALCRLAGVWVTEDPAMADGYAMADAGWMSDVRGDQGQVYDVIVDGSRAIGIDETTDASVTAAVEGGADVLILSDRAEIFVLDPTIIEITGCVDEEGEDLL